MVETLFAAVILGAGLVVVSAFSSLLAFRFGAPLLLLFLAIGLLAGEDGLGIFFDDADAAYFIGALALAVVLFDSGFGTSIQSFRQAAAPALALATFGVVVTTLIVGAVAALVLDVGWIEGMLLGSIVASTDAAAVFFLLRIGGIVVRPRVRSVLEIESGTNDPIAIFLTLTLVEMASQGPDLAAMTVGLAVGFVAHMGLGVVFGLLGGGAIVWLVRGLDLDRGLTPIFVLALGLFVFGVAGALGGSGFLAVYVAGLVAGNGRLDTRASLERFQAGMTWLAQIVMFIVLGLLATPRNFPEQAPAAILLALVLIFVARPVAVWLSLLPFDFGRREEAFIAWVGLRGAVSILLAILPIVGGLEIGGLFFNTVFLMVIISLLAQGWSISFMARKLGLVIPPKMGEVEKVELELPGTVDHELLSYRVVEGSPVTKGGRLPRWAWPSLVVRDGRSMRFQFAGGLKAGDRIFLFVTPRYPRLLDRLFASPLQVNPDDDDFYGVFGVAPDTPLSTLAEEYAIPIALVSGGGSVGDYMTKRLGGHAEVGDRAALGPINLIVREIDERGRISEVGLALEPETAKPVPMPLFQNWRDIRASFETRLRPAAERLLARLRGTA